MKKYWHVIGFGIQNNLTYRVNYLTRTLFSFIPLCAMLSLWRTTQPGKGRAAPPDQNQGKTVVTPLSFLQPEEDGIIR
jgi:hypothetical protein